MPEFKRVSSKEEYAVAAGLFREYAREIGIDLGFQDFEKELVDLSSMYAKPLGGIILCRVEDVFIACVAIRKQAGGIAELKRMYVRPGFQNLGIGRQLMEKAIELAKELGYQKIRLDTLDTMHPAIHLYKTYGFTEIPAYYHNPISNAVYFERAL